ncbi:hypothetical protein B4102_4094 [Heyndrickxia sporothermodurans]|uniref:Uncharacterized protein n=1 Tax=Heyndrickxia sporothermodurans TaxID=46224 RepID=A0A150KKA9_9BACI|nr:hypothetical protein B4102_4094 [Heyndrickxia sporothermodurans]
MNPCFSFLLGNRGKEKLEKRTKERSRNHRKLRYGLNTELLYNQKKILGINDYE